MTTVEERPFGIGPFRPKCLQVLATIRGFVLLVATYSVFTGMFSTYSISQITTIEKHFGMTSEQSGFLFTIQDIGFFALSPFMGIFFCRLHRPRVIAFCCLGQALSNLCFILPFIMHMSAVNSGEKLVETYSNDTNTQGLCLVRSGRVNKTCEVEVEVMMGVSDDVAYGLMAFGMFVNGAGATGLWSLGIAYIDDNATQLESPKLLGFMFCLRFLAPIFGSLLGSGVSSLPVHIEAPDAEGVWIGAWWLGYIAIGTVTSLCILPLAMFPRNIPKPVTEAASEPEELKLKTQDGDDEDKNYVSEKKEDENEEFDKKDLYRALVRIITNGPFMLFCFALAMDIAGGVAYASFLPKYLEDQFYVTSSVSNLIMGVCVPLADAVGLAFSGWFMSKTRSRLSRLFMVAVGLTLCIYLVHLTLIIPTCPTVQIQGISTGEMVQSCNELCDCGLTRYAPVCGADGMTYYSPCFAGCTDMNGLTYENCACLNATSPSLSTAVKGLCTDQCDTSLIVYASILFLINMAGSTLTMIYMMFILRIVQKKDKALGQSTINICAAIGSMPAATLFGRLIDSMCVMFYPSTSGCSESSSGACVSYDRHRFRTLFHGGATGLRIFAVLCYLFVWFGIRNRKFDGDDERMKQEKKRFCSCEKAIDD